MTATHAVPRGNKAKAAAVVDLGEAIASKLPGVDEVLAGDVVTAAAIALEQVPCAVIDVGTNVRIDPGELAEMAASIAELGVLQPVKVVGPRPDGRYGLVWGQRRLLASIQAGKATIPAWVVPTADVDAPGPRRSIEQLAENLQRADLNPIDEAKAIRDVLAGEKGLTQTELAKRLGMSTPWLSNTLALLDAAEPVQELVAREQLTPSHVKALRGLAPATQASLAKKAVADGWSAHRLETGVQDYKRDEHWRKDAEARAAKDTAAKKARFAASIQKLADKKIALDTPIVVLQYQWNSAAAGHVVDAIKKAGYTKVRAGSDISPRASAVGCDCTAWKVEEKWDGTLAISPGCVKPAHIAAKSKLSDHLDAERRKLAERSREVLKGRLLEECRGLPRMLARIVLWRSLDWGVNDWVRDHKVAGKPANAWEQLTALTDEQLAVDLAEYLTKRFQDQNGIKLDWDAIATELGLVNPVIELPAEAPKPVRAKKAAS